MLGTIPQMTGWAGQGRIWCCARAEFWCEWWSKACLMIEGWALVHVWITLIAIYYWRFWDVSQLVRQRGSISSLDKHLAVHFSSCNNQRQWNCCLDWTPQLKMNAFLLLSGCSFIFTLSYVSGTYVWDGRRYIGRSRLISHWLEQISKNLNV